MKNNTSTFSSSSFLTLGWGSGDVNVTGLTRMFLSATHPTTALILLASVIIFCIQFGSKLRHKKKGQLPPGPVPWPVIGNIPELLTKRPAYKWIEKLMKEMNTDIACIRLGSTHIIPVKCPIIAREFLKKQDAIFASRPITMGTEYSSRGFLSVAVAPWGDQWKKMRRVVASEVLSPARLRWLLEKRTEEADNLVRYVYNQCMNTGLNDGAVVDVRTTTRAYSGNVIRKLMFNKRYFGKGRSDGGPGVEEQEHVDALFTVLHGYLLRRTKEETIGHMMMGKEDNVVFCAMSELQKRVYKRTLQLPEIQCLINKDLPCSCGSPLKQVECCSKIVPNGIIWSYIHRDNPDGCPSCPFCLVLPCLVKLQQVSNHLELIKPNPRDDIEKQRKDAEFASAVFSTDIDLVGGSTQSESFMGLSDVEHCGKMRALERLMVSWASHGDKILLFSYSVRMLDILEKFLIRKGYCFSRLDGSTPTSSRQCLVDEFNSSPSKQVFLISTRAGGLGLNLISANRVVIFDPNWNPAQDLQAQDRSFRYGQRRHVVVFRMLAAGSLEELVYTRQVYKQQLSNIAVSGKMEKRYFEGVQDCKEYQGELFGISNLFRDLSDKLFTGEIVEKGEDYRHQGERKDGSSEVGKDIVPFDEANEAFLPGAVANKSIDSEIAFSNKSSLEDLGIVYAHRNEDIVNLGPRLTEKKDENDFRDEHKSHQVGPTSRKRRADGTHTVGETDTSLLERRKKEQFLLLAQFKGMGVIEFSKWLLSSSPSDREKLLREYKKRKEKILNG